MKKPPGQFDQIIGVRIRAFRQERGLSQGDLAERLGISFQQIQKYESGVNHVSVSRLVEIAHALDVPIQRFLPEDETATKLPDLERISKFAFCDEGRRLNLAFVAIKERRIRLAVVALLERICDGRSKAQVQIKSITPQSVAISRD